MKASAVAALALSFAAGCAPLAHERPELPLEVPAAWSAPGSGEAVSAEPWWRTFGDPALSSAVREALEHNWDLAAAAARVDAAAAQARIAGADLWPQLGAAGSGSRDQIVIPSIQIGGSPLRSLTNTYGVSLDVSWEIDLWGRLRAHRRAGALSYEAAQADYQAARHSLAAQTAKAWFSWREAELQRDLAQRTLESFEQTHDVVRRRFASGRGSAFDVRLSESEVAGARSLLALRTEQRDRAVRQLEILLGRYPDGDLAASQGLPVLATAPSAGLPSELLRRRPDLISAERRLRAADETLYEARASLWPSLSLTGSAGRTSAALEDLVDPDFDVWSIGANLFAPIFQGGRLRASVQLAEAELHQVLALYARDVLAAFSEVETLLVVESSLAEQELHDAEAARSASSAYALAQERYAAGREDITALLTAQRRSIEAEVSLLDTRRRRLDARADLYLALGGGFDLEPAAQEQTEGPEEVEG